MARSLVALVFVAIFVTGVAIAEPRFLNAQSIESILLWMPLIAVAAVGQMLVVLSGGIDISVGSILGFSGIAVGLVMKANPEIAVPVVFLAGAAVGLALGFVNAAIVAWAKVPPLIVTIGTLAGFRGLTFLVSKGDQIDSSMVPESMTRLANTGVTLLGVTFNWLLVFAIAFALIAAFLLKKSLAGRNLFAFGSNPVAAHFKGISGNAVTLWAYSLCGMAAGIAGAMYAARFGFVNPGTAGQNFELTVIAAVAIGGTKLTGGVGSVFGVMLGCLLLSCINVGLAVLGIDANWQMLAYGVVILVAVVVDGIVGRRQS